MNKTAALLLCTALFAQQKGTFTDMRDGKVYKTVKIGEQVWMAENLNYEASDSKCYDNKPANCNKYGRLYNWETAKTVCPNGWHLPANYELDVLLRYVDCVSDTSILYRNPNSILYQNPNSNPNSFYSLLMVEEGKQLLAYPSGWYFPKWYILYGCTNSTSDTSSYHLSRTAGKFLKATNGWNWNIYRKIDGNGEDKFGFSALPGGLFIYHSFFPKSLLSFEGGYYIYNTFSDAGQFGNWWSSSEYNSEFADRLHMDYGNYHASRDPNSKKNSLSVRCVQD